MEEMKEINKKLQLDDNFVKKFGLLKKATIYLHFGRDKDAKRTLANAAKIVQDQKQYDAQRMEAI